MKKAILLLAALVVLASCSDMSEEMMTGDTSKQNSNR